MNRFFPVANDLRSRLIIIFGTDLLTAPVHLSRNITGYKLALVILLKVPVGRTSLVGPSILFCRPWSFSLPASSVVWSILATSVACISPLRAALSLIDSQQVRVTCTDCLGMEATQHDLSLDEWRVVCAMVVSQVDSTVTTSIYDRHISQLLQMAIPCVRLHCT